MTANVRSSAEKKTKTRKKKKRSQKESSKGLQDNAKSSGAAALQQGRNSSRASDSPMEAQVAHLSVAVFE